MAPITLTPIGLVHSPRVEVKDDFWGNVTSVIELDAGRFTPDSVLGLTDFSHILVVYSLHAIPDESVVTADVKLKNSQGIRRGHGDVLKSGIGHRAQHVGSTKCASAARDGRGAARIERFKRPDRRKQHRQAQFATENLDRCIDPAYVAQNSRSECDLI